MIVSIARKADTDEIEVPDRYEVLDATALGKRLGLKRDTVLTYYLSRKNFGRIPKPNRRLAMGPIWFEKGVGEWEAGKGDEDGEKAG